MWVAISCDLLTASSCGCTHADVIGVEICGSLKNVLAIAAGIVEGLELGPNAMAALVAQVRTHLLECEVDYCFFCVFFLDWLLE